MTSIKDVDRCRLLLYIFKKITIEIARKFLTIDFPMFSNKRKERKQRNRQLR